MPQFLPRNPFYALLFGLVVVFLVVALIGWESEPGVLTKTAQSADRPAHERDAVAPPPAPAATPAETETVVSDFVEDEELVETADGEEPAGESAEPDIETLADTAPNGSDDIKDRMTDGTEPGVRP